MSYYEVRDWLESFIPQVYSKKELGLERIRYFLKLLGNPQDKFKSIHVAGTSGKGSTCWYIAKLLEQGTNKSVILGSETTPESALFVDSGLSQNDKKGLKVGLHISPHLVDIRERMQIFDPFDSTQGKQVENDNSIMPMGRFLRLFNEIKPVVEKIQKEKPDLTPSYFEILVAASFKYFAEEKVDWAVVEVGLGGRLDATNVLVPEVSVITNVGLDHTEILGRTVEKIAYEKAGIIKKVVPVVTGYPSTLLRQAQDRSGSSISHKSSKSSSGRALEVIADVAKKQQAPLITKDTQDPLLANKQSFSANKLLALAAVEAAGINVDAEAVEEAFKAKFAGRMEEIEPGVILDGAHNPDKIRYLIESIRKWKVESGKLKITLVLAFKKGKDWKRMVDLLFQNLDIERCIATQFYSVTDTGRFAAVEPEEIASYIKSKWTCFASEARREVKVESREYSQEAVFEAINANSKQLTANSSKQLAVSGKQLVLVTGSLYLVGEVRTMWKLPEI